MHNLSGVEKARGGWARRPLRFFLSLGLAACLLVASRDASAQSRESATAGGLFVWVGGGASGYYLQYGQTKNLGVTAYVDADSIHRFGIEAEGRWLQFNQTNEIHADTYLAGPRYHFNVGRFQPYVKGLAGM